MQVEADSGKRTVQVDVLPLACATATFLVRRTLSLPRQRYGTTQASAGRSRESLELDVLFAGAVLAAGRSSARLLLPRHTSLAARSHARSYGKLAGSRTNRYPCTRWTSRPFRSDQRPGGCHSPRLRQPPLGSQRSSARRRRTVSPSARHRQTACTRGRRSSRRR